MYDRETLYIGVVARDQEPSRVVSRILARDKLMAPGFFSGPEFAGDDAIALLFDPFHDHRNAVIFATNARGAEFDALLTDEGREFNVDWRAVWRVAAAIVPEGWSAEFAIPFRTLRYPTGTTGQPWGFNVYRVIRRKNEFALWSGWSRENGGFQRVSLAGHLEGLTDLPRPGVNLEIKPFVLGQATREQETTGPVNDGKLSLGGDVKWQVRPGLLLDVTALTDFAQVEVDDQQVNLTRFSLFFPEKRDFFLENAGIFEFGVRRFGEPPPFLLFFSRQIGIAEDGIVPIVGGGRLTGRIGAQTVGLLNVVTDEAWGQPVTNLAVARIKRDAVGGYLGAMLTDRRGGDSVNTAGGVDWSFWPTPQLNVQGFAARTHTRGTGGEGTAYRIGAATERDRWGFDVQHVFIGEETEAKAGFITRSDIRRTGGYARGTARPGALGIRRLSLFVAGDLVTRADGVLQDWSYGPGINPEWDSGENLAVFFLPKFTRLDEEFDLTDSVTVLAGDYRGWQVGWFGNTSPGRPVVLNSFGNIERFFDGHLVTIGGTVSAAAGAHVAVQAGYTRNAVDIPAGAFTADIGSLRLTYAVSTKLVANALLQYNSLDREVSANVRLNFIHRPGSDLFLVLNEARGSDASVWDLANRGAVVKLTYLARL